MSQINAYGIDAGRSIAGEPDDDSDRIRQRRLTTAQRAEHDKRSAALRERFIQAECAEAAYAECQQENRPRSDTALRNAQLTRPKAGAGQMTDRQSGTSLASQTPAQERKNPRKDNKLGSTNFPATQILQDALQTQEELVEAEKIPARCEYPAARDCVQQTDAMAGPAEQQSGTLLLPTRSLSQLVDDLASLRGPQFADKLASQLENILKSLSNARKLSMHQGEFDEVRATLDFLEGYVEASSFKEVSQQWLMQLTGELRQQLLGVGVLDPASFGMTPLALASQVVVGTSHKVGAMDSRVGGRQRPSAAERRESAEHEAEIEAELSGAAAAQAQLSSDRQLRSSKSNLSKDAEKRREDTVLSVTVRSV